MKKVKLVVGIIFVILALVISYQSSLVNATLSFANSTGSEGNLFGFYFSLLIALAGLSEIIFRNIQQRLIKWVPALFTGLALVSSMVDANKNFPDLKLWGIMAVIFSLGILIGDLYTQPLPDDEDRYIQEIETTKNSDDMSRRTKYKNNDWITTNKSWWLILIANLCFLIVAMLIGFTMINHSLHGALMTRTAESAVSSGSDDEMPVADVSDPNNVGHAPLRKVGQYFYSDHYGKISLLGLSTTTKHSQSVGQVSTTVDLVKIATNKPMNADQRFNSGNDFDTNEITGPYTYLKAQYTVTNNSSHSIIVGGLKQIVLPDQKQINSSDKTVIDSGQGEELAPNAKRSYYLHILLNRKSDTYRPRFVHLYFAELSNSESFVIRGSQFDVTMPINYKN
ncbi:CPBP family intramembrane glutamic endopeptidase [Lentilactobacillus kosonis]|uniref:Uncharacterized protein n=1 Tax=Lentilactobacillus kosonis TaxID=2810561 RepID=A0A401FNR8_9LACO|nr:CPBP family intramembrane glutamic endopeptidase [Lentilactobacillus kosonis]GAY73956.1 hypothetical protein NBRC111893_2102 [Lentilactobacillus kosonis]